MEFGIQMHTIDKFQKLLNKYPLILLFFQFITVEKKSLTGPMISSWTHEAEYYQRYYQEKHYCCKKPRMITGFGDIWI